MAPVPSQAKHRRKLKTVKLLQCKFSLVWQVGVHAEVWELLNQDARKAQFEADCLALARDLHRRCHRSIPCRATRGELSWRLWWQLRRNRKHLEIHHQREACQASTPKEEPSMHLMADSLLVDIHMAEPSPLQRLVWSFYGEGACRHLVPATRTRKSKPSSAEAPSRS